MLYGVSPSTRREWIEMQIERVFRRQKFRSLPPHGGSGLKSETRSDFTRRIWSPSTRREWIEIKLYKEFLQQYTNVSLHTEGVD